MQGVNHSHFDPFVNSVFTGMKADIQAEFKLIQVSVRRRINKGLFRENPFTLVFRCARKIILPQGLYQMATTNFDTMDIFVTAVGADAEGIIYHAVFD